VVATNATLDRTGLEALAHAAGDALARRIVPYGTLFDGDVVFAVSTAVAAPATPLQAEALAALAVPIAVERAVRLARDSGTSRVSLTAGAGDRSSRSRYRRRRAQVGARPRLGVLEVTVEPQRVAGCTTSRDALAALRRIARDAGRAADVRLLPDASVRDEPAAVVTAAVAPLLREPRIAADRASEALHASRSPCSSGARREGHGCACAQATATTRGPRRLSGRRTERMGGRLEHAGHGTAHSVPSSSSRISASGLPVGARVALRRNGQVETRTDAGGM